MCVCVYVRAARLNIGGGDGQYTEGHQPYMIHKICMFIVRQLAVSQKYLKFDCFWLAMMMMMMVLCCCFAFDMVYLWDVS